MKSPKTTAAFLLTIVLTFFCFTDVSAQKWKKKKPETLYARNKKKNATPIFVGIGTKTPTAQFHTIGSVRHEGLTVNNALNSIVAVDGNGNLFWRDISNTLGNAWFLNGNTITGSNFFGTTNNENIRIRTNNIQRAVITSGGLLGLGVAVPSAQLHTNGSVRFEGLSNNDVANRLVSMDNNGNLSWRDAASIAGSAWLVNGNVGTASNFLGTTNNEDFRLRTNNLQRAVITSGGSFGLGVTAPSAQLHTTGTVRLEGIANNNTLQRLALFDNNGNLFYRDLASLQSNFWSLTGNTGTNPSTNFLGTADNNRLVFRTNNTEKMTILSNGNVGIGLSTPSSPLHVFSTTDDNQLFLSGSAPSTRYFQGSDWNTSAFHARIGLATGNANYVATSSPGDFIVQAMDNGNLLFGTNGSAGNGLERMRINPTGNVGISTTNPTAKLHTNGTVRHEGLANGTGNPLVVDANGNVFVGTNSASNAWNLIGNSGTNPAINFLGTTDNNRLVFRTNNTEKMTILPSGRVGIGTTNPLVTLHLSDNPGGMGFPYEAMVAERGGDMRLGVYCSNPSPIGANGGGAAVSMAYTNYTYPSGLYPGYDMQFGALNNSSYYLRFSSVQRNTAGTVVNALAHVMIMDNNGNVGINLGPAGNVPNLPTAKLHTSGTLRHEGLATGTGNPLVVDANGNVFVGTGSASNAWSLTGNTATNPANNFLGTTDNNRLVFRTNNTEKMTILSNGNVGIGLSNPSSPLQVFSTTDDNQLFISGSAPSARYFQGSDWNTSAFHARIGLATGNANYVATSSPGDFIVQVLDNGNLLFGTNGAAGNGLERMRINPIGYTGISTINPTAKLHVNCVAVPGQSNPSNIRFENIPTGTGNALVMDANGYVYKSNTLTGRPEEVTELRDEIRDLKKEIEELKSAVNSMKKGSFIIGENKDEAILYQNAPNPFKNTTIIRYYLPENFQKAFLQITDLQGNILKTYQLNGGGQQSTAINGSELSSGTYFYTLFVDGKQVDSKKMILTR